MSIRLALSCAVSVVAMTSAASAQPDRVATKVLVSDRGVNFSDPAATAAFYVFLQRAAARACESGMNRNLTIVAADRECAAQSLDQAVRQVGKPSLLALHESRTGRTAPATMLASQ